VIAILTRLGGKAKFVQETVSKLVDLEDDSRTFTFERCWNWRDCAG